MVAEVANLLHTYTVSLTSQNLIQVHKILQCLIEMCVGNAENQQVILDKLIVEPLNRILQHPVPTNTSEKVSVHSKKLLRDYDSNEFIVKENEELVQLVQAKGSVVELISVMMEEIDSEASKVIEVYLLYLFLKLGESYHGVVSYLRVLRQLWMIKHL